MTVRRHNQDFTAIAHHVCILSEIHEPPAKVAEKLGYALPLVKHNEARERAIRRYKTPGDE